MRYSSFLCVLLILGALQLSWCQEIEKLDSITRFDYDLPGLASKSIYQYDALGRDTTIADYNYDQGSETLRLTRQIRTQFAPDQRIIEVFDALANRPQSRLTIRLDEDGAEQESITEQWNPQTASLEPVLRFVTTSLTPTRWDREQYSWDGSQFVLEGRELLEYEPAGSEIRTSFRLEDMDFVPDQRITQLFDESTGVETRYLIENYFPLTVGWAPFLDTRTTLDEMTYLGTTLTDVASFDTGLLERFDSTLVQYNADWTSAAAVTFRPLGPGGTYVRTQELVQTYTDAANLAVRDRYLPNAAGTSLELVQTDTYYYSELDLATSIQPIPADLPVSLRFENPMTQGRVSIVGPSTGESYVLRLSEPSGHTISQRIVRAGDWLDLNPQSLPRGWYVLTLSTSQQRKSWKLIVL